MSFKIFSLQLTGKIKPVETIENQRETLQQDYTEFQQVKNSEELADFLVLENYVNSEQFKKKKSEISDLEIRKHYPNWEYLE